MRAGFCWLFTFMNIHTAAGYMKHGYRIRRAIWEKGEYLSKDYYVGHTMMVPSMIRNSDGSFTHNKRPWSTDWHPEPEDLMADDWELILEGVIEGFPVTYDS